MIFLINVPIGLAAVLGAPKFLPIGRGERKVRLDVLGAVIAVPLEYRHHVVGVIEVISGPSEPYGVRDTELISAFARGAVSGLLSGRGGIDSP